MPLYLPPATAAAAADPGSPVMHLRQHGVIGTNSLAGVDAPRYYAINAYGSNNIGSTGTNMTANAWTVIPFWTGPGGKLNSLDVYVTGASAGNLKLAIWTNKTGRLYPDQLHLASSDIAATGGTRTWTLPAGTTMPAGKLYWVGYNNSTATALRIMSPGVYWPILGWASPDPNYSANSAWGFRTTANADQYTNVPATFPTDALILETGTNPPVIFSRWVA